MVEDEGKTNPEIFIARTIQTVCRRGGLTELQTNRIIKDGLEMRERGNLQSGSDLSAWIDDKVKASLK